MLHVVYSQPTANSPADHNFHLPGLAGTVFFNFQELPGPTLFSQTLASELGKSRKKSWTFQQEVWEARSLMCLWSTSLYEAWIEADVTDVIAVQHPGGKALQSQTISTVRTCPVHTLQYNIQWVTSS